MTTMDAVAGRLRTGAGRIAAAGLVVAVALAVLGIWLASSAVGLVDAWATTGADATAATGDPGFQVIVERYATPDTPPFGQVFARLAAAGAVAVWALRLAAHGVVAGFEHLRR